MSDVVNHPEHYISDSGIETIDVIEAFTKDIKDPFEAYCTGNIIKYICRWPNKNGVEDLKKARWYLDKLIDHHDKNENLHFAINWDDIAPDVQQLLKDHNPNFSNFEVNTANDPRFNKEAQKRRWENIQKNFWMNRTNNTDHNEEA